MRSASWRLSRCFLTCYTVLVVFSELCGLAITVKSGAERPVGEMVVGALYPTGEEHLFQSWNATFATYLTERVGPAFGVTFRMIPLNFTAQFDAVEHKMVDFTFTDPSVYACLEREFLARPVVSLRKQSKVGDSIFQLDRFYGVFIVRSNSSIKEVADIRGKVVEAVSLAGLGGCQLQWDELANRDLQFLSDPKQVRFSGDQTRTVRSVLAGEVDIGLVRTGVVESMVSEGSIESGSVRVLENLQGRPDDPDFPFAHSTRLAAPEWVLAGLPWADWNLTRAVFLALAAIPPSHPAAVAGQYAAWEAPPSYFGMHQMLERLNRIDSDDKCLREGDVCATVVCPAGQLRKSCQQIKDGCKEEGLSCPEGYICLCSPCLTINQEELVVKPLVVLALDAHGVRYSSNVNTHAEYQALGGHCITMRTCITVERSDLVTLQVEDRWATYRQSRDYPAIDALEYKWAIDQTGVEVWHSAARTTVDSFQMNISAHDLGSNLLRVRTCSAGVCVEYDKSPYVISVVEKVCAGTMEPRAEDALCVCQPGFEYAESSLSVCVASSGGSGSWVSVWAAAAVLVVVLCVVGGVGVYYCMQMQQMDAAWRISPEELHFPETRVVLGRGAHGQVLKAHFRKTDVAVKRVLPKSKRESSANTKTSRLCCFKSPGAEVGSPNRGIPSFSNQIRDVLVYFNRRSRKKLRCADGSYVVGHDAREGSTKRSAFHILQSVGTLKKLRATDMNLVREKSRKARKSWTVLQKLKMGLDGNDSEAEVQFRTESEIDMQRCKFSGSGTGLSSQTIRSLKKQFAKEMKMMVFLRHPNIVTVMGAVVHKGVDSLLVTEFMKHGSLYDLLHVNHTMQFDSEIVMGILEGVVRGMMYLHSSKPPILHNDLKSANILIGSNFSAKIADFGLSMKTRSTGSLGTPFWMAPELFVKGSKPSQMTDVYSFGVTMFEIFMRQEPYEEYQDIQVVVERLGDVESDTPLRPTIPDGLPAAVADLMRMCWHSLPANRPSFDEIRTIMADFNLEEIDNWFSRGRHALPGGARTANQLLYDVFPAHVANTLRQGKKVEPEQHDCVTIFFSDIVGFTDISRMLQPIEVMDMLDRLYFKFDALARKHDVFKVETIGDAYMAVANLVKDQPKHTELIARFALDAIQTANETIIHEGQPDLGFVNIRVGFHSGPVVSSVVGNLNPRFCLFGDTVNTSSRMESHSEKNQIHLTEFAAEILKEQAPDVRLTCRGVTSIKGKGHMITYWLEGFGPLPGESEILLAHSDAGSSRGNSERAMHPDASAPAELESQDEENMHVLTESNHV